MSVVVDKVTKCDQVLNDLSRIAGVVNHKMHLDNLHSRVDIFFYIDRSIQARDLCSKLQLKPDEEITRQLAELHLVVMERWQEDRKVLSPEPQIIL